MSASKQQGLTPQQQGLTPQQIKVYELFCRLKSGGYKDITEINFPAFCDDLDSLMDKWPDICKQIGKNISHKDQQSDFYNALNIMLGEDHSMKTKHNILNAIRQKDIFAQMKDKKIIIVPTTLRHLLPKMLESEGENSKTFVEAIVSFIFHNSKKHDYNVLRSLATERMKTDLEFSIAYITLYEKINIVKPSALTEEHKELYASAKLNQEKLSGMPSRKEMEKEFPVNLKQDFVPQTTLGWLVPRQSPAFAQLAFPTITTSPPPVFTGSPFLPLGFGTPFLPLGVTAPLQRQFFGAPLPPAGVPAPLPPAGVPAPLPTSSTGLSDLLPYKNPKIEPQERVNQGNRSGQLTSKPF